MPLSVKFPASALSRAICLLAASALIGCASKNPLIDEPVAAAPVAQPAPAPASAPAAAPQATPVAKAVTPAAIPAAAPTAPAQAAAPATQPAQPAQAAQPAQTAAASAPAPAATGVQTTQQKRLFGIFSPYKIDVQQGNFISQEQLSQLKTGMTPDQVHFVLGTPLLNDLFHANRWDYVFRMQKGSGEVISSRIAVHFQDNRVARIEAGTLPSEQDYLSMIAGSKPDAPKANK